VTGAALRPVETRLIVHERSAPGLALETLARDAGVHPELVRRLVALGIFDSGPAHHRASRVARAVRLRRDLGLSYSGALFAGELLDRIDELERRLRRYEPAGRKRR
jgi:chaperone modulatory protein CbpM